MPATVAIAPKPLSELRSFLDAVITRLRRRRQFAAQLDVEVASDIACDVAQVHAKVSALAHSAEVHDVEALQAIDRALSPDGPGGIAIVPSEAALIRACVDRSARYDKQIGELLG